MAARTDLSELLRHARALGWVVKVLTRDTVAVTHPDAGELLVSCATKRWLGRRRLAEVLEKQAEEAKHAEDAMAEYLGIPF